ncbi:TM2 domain-containing protein [Arthrobacter psychrolactophilus]|uniref:TM2 domain-containing protein n=1 Tax=Arthrobacter psychrolactophilus TaxID=92442 RepID=A0A2V5IYA2_9MICC|nr:TM2 domain-containing protein [Arthrobacter psychrolactophilus]PYI39353.1 TM2 domain-containing protein [Arthrobacter psychrolactophilus]
MTENNNPEKSSDVPAGYDQPAPGYQAPPSYSAPVAPEAPATFAPPAAPSYPQPPVAPAPVAPQATYSQPNYSQPGGYQQPAYAAGYGAEQKSKVVAGILGILLGTLGIHNFYLGKTKIALIQLLVSVLSFGILAWAIGIWGLVEGILILIGSENYRNDGKGIPLKD